MKSTIGLEASVVGTRESEVEAAGTKHEGVTCAENWYIRQTYIKAHNDQGRFLTDCIHFLLFDA